MRDDGWVMFWIGLLIGGLFIVVIWKVDDELGVFGTRALIKNGAAKYNERTGKLEFVKRYKKESK